MKPVLHICVPNYRGWVEAPHHDSMFALAHYLGSQARGVCLTNPSHTILSTARQICVQAALADPNCDRVLFIDDDMIFRPEQFAALEQEFDQYNLDFLGSLAFANSIPTKPCIFGKNPEIPEWGDTQWWYICLDYPKQCRFQVYATGFGMCLIRRGMLEALVGEKRDKNPFVGSWPCAVNEDIAFCLNAHRKGFKLYVDSRVSIGHISKERPIIDESVYEAQGDAAEYNLGIEYGHMRDVDDPTLVRSDKVQDFAVYEAGY